MTPVTPQAEAPSTNQKTSSGHLFENQLQPVLQNGSKCIELYSSIFHYENTEIDNSRRSWNVEVWRFYLSKRWTRPRIFQIFRKINKLFEVRSLPGHLKPNPGKNIQTHRISGNEIQDAWQFQRMSEKTNVRKFYFRDYKKLNLTAITPVLKPPFPCPVEVLKYYFYRQDNKLRKSET